VDLILTDEYLDAAAASELEATGIRLRLAGTPAETVTV
jgi:hypothetical protein